MNLPCYIAGKPVSSDERCTIRSPYNGEIVGSVALAGREHADAAISTSLAARVSLSRYERSTILDAARRLLETRREEFARLVTGETGLCLREARYETGRALDVLRFAAMEAL